MSVEQQETYEDETAFELARLRKLLEGDVDGVWSITPRHLFAAAALAGAMANPSSTPTDDAAVAKTCFEMADAMLEAEDL